jgi:hypothetical protein
MKEGRSAFSSAAKAVVVSAGPIYCLKTISSASNHFSGQISALFIERLEIFLNEDRN